MTGRTKTLNARTEDDALMEAAELDYPVNVYGYNIHGECVFVRTIPAPPLRRTGRPVLFTSSRVKRKRDIQQPLSTSAVAWRHWAHNDEQVYVAALPAHPHEDYEYTSSPLHARLLSPEEQKKFADYVRLVSLHDSVGFVRARD